MTKLLISSLLLIFSLPCFSSNELDKLKSVWQSTQNPLEQRFEAFNQFYLLNTSDNPNTSALAARQHLILAKKHKNFRQIIKAYNELSIINTYLGKPDSSMFYIQESILIAEQLNDSLILGKLYVNHGSILRDNGKLKEAVSRYLQSLSIFEKLNSDAIYLADINNNLGLVYLDLELFDIAQKYFDKALLLYKQCKGNKAIGNIWLNIGQTHYSLGHFNQSKSAVLRAITMLKEEKNALSIIHAYLIAGGICGKELKSDSASYYFSLALKSALNIGNDNFIIEALVDKMNFQYSKNQDISQNEIDLLANRINLATNVKTKASGARLLYKLFKSKGKSNKALEMLELYTAFSDTLHDEQNKLSFIRETIQDDFEKKIHFIEMENGRIQNQKEMIHQKNIFFISLLSIGVVFFIFWYFNKKLVSNKNQKIELLNEINLLKKMSSSIPSTSNYAFNRAKIEETIHRKLNETDWKVLLLLFEDPTYSNREIADKACMSIDGIGSSLKRMYVYFEVKETKYRKIALIHSVLNKSNSN